MKSLGFTILFDPRAAAPTSPTGAGARLPPPPSPWCCATVAKTFGGVGWSQTPALNNHHRECSGLKLGYYSFNSSPCNNGGRFMETPSATRWDSNEILKYQEVRCFFAKRLVRKNKRFKQISKSTLILARNAVQISFSRCSPLGLLQLGCNQHFVFNLPLKSLKLSDCLRDITGNSQHKTGYSVDHKNR